jgi:NAD(P)-dependent dehydrogenase (short-subunit alcohol dehydrogenase family)
MTGRVEGKGAFVTGAARGPGRSHAIRLAEEGAEIIAVDICDQVASVPYPMATLDDLAQTVKEVEALGRRIVASQARHRRHLPGRCRVHGEVENERGGPARPGEISSQWRRRPLTNRIFDV